MKYIGQLLMSLLFVLAISTMAYAGPYYSGGYYNGPIVYPFCPTGVWVSNGNYYGPAYGPCHRFIHPEYVNGIYGGPYSFQSGSGRGGRDFDRDDRSTRQRDWMHHR
jgi:hypothetical protein